MSLPSIDFSKGNGLVPVVVQDATSLRVLMLGYMNAEAYAQTLASGFVTFYSRSKQRLWRKGETSGNTLHLVDIKIDCDQDTLLAFVHPSGPVCHTGATSCFEERDVATLSILDDLQKLIWERRDQPIETSYTSSLFHKGIDRIAQKVGEEGVEVALAGATGAPTVDQEVADLLYHVLVLLAYRNVRLQDVLSVLKERQKQVCVQVPCSDSYGR